MRVLVKGTPVDLEPAQIALLDRCPFGIEPRQFFAWVAEYEPSRLEYTRGLLVAEIQKANKVQGLAKRTAKKGRSLFGN